MNIGGLPLFEWMQKKLDWLGQKQKIVSENLANADTPHFKTRDIKPINFEDMVASRTTAPLQTNPQHLGLSQGGYTHKIEKVRHLDTQINGNNVSLEEELMKLNDTKINHHFLTNLYYQHLKLIKTALSQR